MTRRLIGPAVMAAVMLAMTLGLGVWQLQRLAWKTALLASIDRAEALPAKTLQLPPEPFEHVTVAGRFLPMTGLYGAEVRTGRDGAAMGGQLLAALVPASGPVVIVDRGWVPLDASREPPAGLQLVEGYVRPAEKASWSSPASDLVQRRFFTLDPAEIGRAFGLPEVAGFTLVQLGRGAGLPQAATALPRPPNDHLSYAITWFGLSGALLLIFGLFMRQTLRTEPTP